MKKSVIFFGLMAGITLVGCVSDDEAGAAKVNEPAKLTFDSPMMQSNGDSRANYYGEIGDHMYEGSSTVYRYPKEEDFVIYAVQHEGDFAGWANAVQHEINGMTVSYDQPVDGWAPKDGDNYYYWPSGKMSFAASSPADLECGAVRSYGADGVTIENFEVNSSAAHHFDLLYSIRTLNQTSDNMLDGASYYSGIPINFKHALSSVRFSIKNESEASVVLKSIELSGVKYKGTFKENLVEEPTDYSASVSTPKWIVTEDVVSEGNPYVGFAGSVQFPITPQYVASLAASDTDDDGETEQVNQLLVMPQLIPEDASVVVKYTVNGSERTKTAKLKGWKDLSDNVVDEWNLGVRYTYRLVYGASAADKDRIYFAPGTEEWIEHDVIVIQL